MAKSSGYKSICRIDQPKKRHHGWYVRVTWNKETRSKFFSDAKYDGKALALEEAVIYRNQLEQEMGKPRSERLVIAKPRRSNTGVRGVRRIKTTQKKGGRTYIWDVYQVTYHPAPGKTRRTSVSVNRYGEKKAFEIACAIREARTRGEEPPPFPKPERKPRKRSRPKRKPKPRIGITKQYLTKRPNKPQICRVTFRLFAEHANGAKSVNLVGEFNEWKMFETPLKRLANGDFSVTLKLEAGRTYQYRYLINQSEWMNDPSAELAVENNIGGTNSAIYI